MLKFWYWGSFTGGLIYIRVRMFGRMFIMLCSSCLFAVYPETVMFRWKSYVIYECTTAWGQLSVGKMRRCNCPSKKILTLLYTSYRPNKNVRQLLQGAGMQILPLCTLSKVAKSGEKHVNACLLTKLIMYYYIMYTISFSSFFMSKKHMSAEKFSTRKDYFRRLSDDFEKFSNSFGRFSQSFGQVIGWLFNINNCI